MAKKYNNGFDSESGYYKVVVGDHINYRYEVLQELDRGAFGQVVRCIDHVDKKEVAIKLNRNSSYDHSSSRTEIAILKKLKAGIDCHSYDEELVNSYKERVVEFKDSFLFRNHYCIVFELLSKNLFFSLKNG